MKSGSETTIISHEYLKPTPGRGEKSKYRYLVSIHLPVGLRYQYLRHLQGLDTRSPLVTDSHAGQIYREKYCSEVTSGISSSHIVP
jgi:hypothetical protein